MTSDAKRAANRRNALRSTGPRSAAAKARTRYNAWRHGLAASHDVSMVSRLQELARQIAGGTHPAELEAAQIAAHAQLEIERVHKLRLDMIERAVRGLQADASLDEEERLALAFLDSAKSLSALDRYERRAQSRRNRALRELSASQKINHQGTTPPVPTR
jgi:hypothetical protein